MPDSNLSKLDSIRTKIRRITKSPSASQISTNDIDAYINSFILYDLPADVSLNGLKTVLRFYTSPNVSSYSTNTVDVNNPLYNFKNAYTLCSNTVFISGNLSYWTDSRSDFYQKYPRVMNEESIDTGDGATVNYVGTIDQYPVLPYTVLFYSVNTLDAYIKLYDDGSGNLSGDGVGTINYVTGAYDITFTSFVKDGETVYAQYSPYTAARPDTVLYYEDTFHLRPVPDKAYTVEVEVFKRPTELINGGDLPDFSLWWEYIALGSARKILIDRGDYDTANILSSELEAMRDEVLYKSVIQNTIKEGYGL